MSEQKKNANISKVNKEMWSISIYCGNSPLSLKPVKQIQIPTITRHHVTDIPASFVADPFMICVEKKWHLFMEIMNADTKLGEIGLTTSMDGLNWTYDQIVLKEDFHLSYPFVFKHNEEYFMIPETLSAGAIRLYKACNFPYDWEFVTDIIKGQFVDATLYFHNQTWETK